MYGGLILQYEGLQIGAQHCKLSLGIMCGYTDHVWIRYTLYLQGYIGTGVVYHHSIVLLHYSITPLLSIGIGIVLYP